MIRPYLEIIYLYLNKCFNFFFRGHYFQNSHNKYVHVCIGDWGIGERSSSLMEEKKGCFENIVTSLDRWSKANYKVD